MDLLNFAPPATGRQAELFWSIVELARSRGELRPHERVLLGVSGGADSTALTLLLSPLRMPEFLGLGLHIAHFDHQLRSRAEAAGDRSSVEELGDRLHIPFTAGTGDVRSHARLRHLSVEDAARRLRYSFFATQANAIGATAVAVGHTADDQAETVLLHLIRGSGLRGLRGMLPRSPWPFGPGPDIVRPLLNLRHADTEYYCKRAGFQPRVDPTNLSIGPTRNRVRHSVLPAMREINPRVDEALTRLAASVESDVEYIERQATGIWNALAVEQDGEIRLPLERFRDLDPALASRLLMVGARRLGGSSAMPERAHLLEVSAHLQSQKHRWSVSFPGGVRVAVRATFIRLTKGSPPPRSAIPPTELKTPGTTEVSGWRIDIRSAPSPTNLSPGASEAYVDKAGVQGALLVRSRKPGDRLRPIGLGGAKKLQDILVDAKVPAGERDGVPLICDDAGILWVVGHCLDERARVRGGARQVLHITARRKI